MSGRTHWRLLCGVCAAPILVACGGGGGGGGAAPPPVAPAPVVPAFQADDFTLEEGNDGRVDVDVTVTLSASTTRTVTVDYATEDGTATAGQDYESSSGTVSFSAGETSASIVVAVIGDRLDEDDETFALRFSNAANATLGTASVDGTITDDDEPPTLELGDARAAESASLEFPLTLSATSGKPISVRYATADGSARAGTDYRPARGTLDIAAGSGSATIPVTIVDDAFDEADETVHLTLSDAANATLGDAAGLGTIADDDDAPTLSVVGGDIVERNVGAVAMLFHVTVSAPSGLPVSVEYATADGSATLADADYQRASGVARIEPHAIGASVAVPVNGDALPEDDETLALVLANATNASIANDRATGTIYDNDGNRPASGLLARPANATCIAPVRPTGDADIGTEAAFPNLPALTQPITLVQAPGQDDAWYAAQQNGLMLRFANDSDVDATTTFADLRGVVDAGASETGLLGFAFHPNFAANGHVYVSYTETGTGGVRFVSVLSRYESNDGGMTLNVDSEVRLMTMDQPYANHNGGHVAFGPDGYLYYAMGDGGYAGDPGDRSQNTRNLFGTLMRIDVDGNAPYAIPDDNPFAANPRCEGGSGDTPCPEIYAWGLRNPWRWHFDAATDELWLGDVGQDAWEEVDIVEAGGNYGWRCREGAHDYDTSGNCPDGLIDPVIEYDANEGNSITGGFVYRGQAIPQLIGRYVFADFERGKLFASVTDENGQYGYEVLLETSFNISSFAQDAAGELLFMDYGGGTLHRIVQASGTSTNTIPDMLSATGCVDPNDVAQPTAGLTPYAINAPFWSDGAQKQRWFAIPDGTTIDVAADGDWVFPVGTVLMKNFSFVGRTFETRLFMRHDDGGWAGYTYEWNAAGTDANRVVGGKTKTINGVRWIFPSESQCMQCHTRAAGFSLGVEHAQLNRDFRYAETSAVVNQLATVDAVGQLAVPLASPPGALPRLAEPHNSGADLTRRSRAYLHSNCANCHRPLTPAPGDMDWRHATPLAAVNACGAVPQSGDLGIAGARLIAPGDAAKSLLVQRATRRDAHGMPPLASTLVDAAGASLLSDWVEALPGCP